MCKKISPSILSADFANLLADVQAVERAGVQLLHIDVMDGHFVPNISYGAIVLKALAGKTTIPFDVHLMIECPELYINEFAMDQTEYITVHAEACAHLHRVVQQIKKLGKRVGVALNPATSLSSLDYIWDDIDMVLIMSVNPGYGGQTFIPNALDKVKAVKAEIEKRGLNIEIQIDGGITLDNIEAVTRAGVDIAVAGSAIFHSENIYETAKQFVNKVLSR